MILIFISLIVAAAPQPKEKEVDLMKDGGLEYFIKDIGKSGLGIFGDYKRLMEAVKKYDLYIQKHIPNEKLILRENSINGKYQIKIEIGSEAKYVNDIWKAAKSGALNHPNITRVFASHNEVYGHKDRDEQVVVSMVCMELPQLYVTEEHINQDESRLRNMVRDILLGMEMIHDSGIVINNIALENVVGSIDLAGRKTYKLFGFDGAVDICTNKSVIHPDSQSVKYHDEDSRNNLLSQARDIYDLGIMIYWIMRRSDETFNQSVIRQIGQISYVFKESITEECKDFIVQATSYSKAGRAGLEELLSHPFITGKPMRQQE
ncbi:AURKA [Enterospora canceri]|uniref:AURKA n=1 Tax=Enterospora canceri TaxID=1081671 RepID=A0A1Y1S7A6_9MICR|nr:AURKA [Enterospora canceri]